MLHACMSYGRGGADLNGHQLFQPIPNVPLLTNGQMVLANFVLLLALVRISAQLLVLMCLQVDHIPFLGNTKEIILKVLISL